MTKKYLCGCIREYLQRNPDIDSEPQRIKDYFMAMLAPYHDDDEDGVRTCFVDKVGRREMHWRRVTKDTFEIIEEKQSRPLVSYDAQENDILISNGKSWKLVRKDQ